MQNKRMCGIRNSAVASQPCPSGHITADKVKTIPHTIPPKEIFRLLKNNEIIGMIADHDGGEKGVFVDFFGRPASTLPSPVVFTMRSGTDLIPLFDIRKKIITITLLLKPHIN